MKTKRQIKDFNQKALTDRIAEEFVNGKKTSPDESLLYRVKKAYRKTLARYVSYNR